jgi:hypothetical protein
VVDETCSIFPVNLPERPQKTHKLQFAKRLSQKLASSKSKQITSIDGIPPLHSLPEKSDPIVFATSAPSTSDVTSPHVLTRSENGTLTSSRAHRLVPMLKQAVSFMRSPGSSNGEYTESVPPDTEILASGSRMAIQSLRHKPVLSNTTIISKEPLVKRLERLRLPPDRKSSRAPPTLPLSARSTSYSPPVPLGDQVIQSNNIARGNKAILDPPGTVLTKDHSTSELRSNSTSQSKQRLEPDANITHQIFIHDEETSNLPAQWSKIAFERRMQTRKRALSPSSHGTTCTSQKLRRQSPIPSISSSSSEGDLTVSSPQNVSNPALSVHPEDSWKLRRTQPLQNRGERFLDSKDALLLQEDMDRRLARRLQYEEDERYHNNQSLHAQLRATAHQLSMAPPTRSKRQHRRSNAGRVVSGKHGTRDDPIDLDPNSELNSDESDEVVLTGRAKTGGSSAPQLDPMDLDGDDWNWNSSDEFGSTQIDLDATLAQLLQEEEQFQQLAVKTRDCVVCGDSHPINELPSLAECTHFPQTCATCYGGWIATQLQGSSWREAKCPESECKVKLTYYEIQQVVTPEIFLQYDTFIARTAMSEDRTY